MRFVEATLVMPLTLLITSALIALMMGFYSDLGEQIEAHGEEIKDVYKRQVVLRQNAPAPKRPEAIRRACNCILPSRVNRSRGEYHHRRKQNRSEYRKRAALAASAERFPNSVFNPNFVPHKQSYPAP